MEKELNAEKITNVNTPSQVKLATKWISNIHLYDRKSEWTVNTWFLDRTYSYKEPDLDGVGDRLQKAEQKQES